VAFTLFLDTTPEKVNPTEMYYVAEEKGQGAEKGHSVLLLTSTPWLTCPDLIFRAMEQQWPEKPLD